MKSVIPFVVSAILLGSSAGASPVTIYWSGTVSFVDTNGSELDFGLSFGDRVDGTFTYDEQPFLDAAAAGDDAHREFDATLSNTFSFKGHTFGFSAMEQNPDQTGTRYGGPIDIDNSDEIATGGPLSSIFTARLADNDLGGFLAKDPYAPGYDSSDPEATAVPITMDGAPLLFSVAESSYQISGTGTGLFGPDLSLDGINLAEFPVSFVNFYILQDIRDENGNLQRQAWVDAQVRFDYWTASGPRPEDPTVPAVPLPAAGWLLLAGVAGLGTVSKRRRKQR